MTDGSRPMAEQACDWSKYPETVSVTLPCYNDGEYIGQAANPPRAKTYRRIELVVA